MKQVYKNLILVLALGGISACATTDPMALLPVGVKASLQQQQDSPKKISVGRLLADIRKIDDKAADHDAPQAEPLKTVWHPALDQAPSADLLAAASGAEKAQILVGGDGVGHFEALSWSIRLRKTLRAAGIHAVIVRRPQTDQQDAVLEVRLSYHQVAGSVAAGGQL